MAMRPMQMEANSSSFRFNFLGCVFRCMPVFPECEPTPVLYCAAGWDEAGRSKRPDAEGGKRGDSELSGVGGYHPIHRN